MRLKFKILSGFLILALMLVIAGAWSIFYFQTIGTSVTKLLDDNYRSINAAKTMIEALEREDSAILLLLLGNWQQGREILASADSLFQEGFETAKNNVTIPGEDEYIVQIDSAYRAYKNVWSRPIVDTRREGNLQWYFQDVHKSFLRAKSAVNKLMEINDQTMYQTASDLKNRAHRAVMPGILAIVAALVFAFIFNYFVNRYMIEPILNITKEVEQFTETKERFSVNVETRDELARLAAAIGNLCASIRDTEAQK